MQHYEKLGLIFTARPDVWWCSHYAGPVFTQALQNGGIRVYFGGTSDERVSRIGYFDLDGIPSSPSDAKINVTPLLDIGRPGCFDENGVDGAWILDISESIRYLYYVGWIKGGRNGYFVGIGLAISEDGGKTYKRASEAPILERTNEEPIGSSSCCVRKIGNLFKMWYTSYDRVELIDGKYTLYYNIRYAESTDGIIWKRNFRTAVDFCKPNENVIGSPYVIFENSIYKMWYSYRSLDTTYRIGYAESKNGIDWERMDSMIGLDIGGKNDWDSDMIEYPHLFDYKNERYMLYCGNNYGKTGIGAARLIK